MVGKENCLIPLRTENADCFSTQQIRQWKRGISRALTRRPYNSTFTFQKSALSFQQRVDASLNSSDFWYRHLWFHLVLPRSKVRNLFINWATIVYQNVPWPRSSLRLKNAQCSCPVLMFCHNLFRTIKIDRDQSLQARWAAFQHHVVRLNRNGSPTSTTYYGRDTISLLSGFCRLIRTTLAQWDYSPDRDHEFVTSAIYFRYLRRAAGEGFGDKSEEPIETDRWVPLNGVGGQLTYQH